MFDFSLYELVVFGIIALIVLGPEKLPQAVRTAGTYYAKFRRTVGTIKAEMEAELDLAETRQKMQEELAKIKQAEADMQAEMARLRGSVEQMKRQSADSDDLPASPASAKTAAAHQSEPFQAHTHPSSDKGQTPQSASPSSHIGPNLAKTPPQNRHFDQSHPCLSHLPQTQFVPSKVNHLDWLSPPYLPHHLFLFDAPAHLLFYPASTSVSSMNEAVT